MEELLEPIMDQLTMALSLVAILAAGAGLLGVVATRQRLGRGNAATAGLSWAVFGFAAMVAAAAVPALTGYIAAWTFPNAAALLNGSLTAVGLICFALFFYRMGRHAASASSGP